MGIRNFWQITRNSTMMMSCTFIGHFNWLRANLGIDTTFSDVLKRSIQTSQVHFAPRKGQAECPQFSDLLHLEYLTLPSSGYNKNIRIVASAFCFTVWAALRVPDAQRLKLTKIKKELLVFYGNSFTQKNPIKGSLAPPVDFVGPLTGILHDRWHLPITEDYVERDFLLFDLSAKLLESNSS